MKLSASEQAIERSSEKDPQRLLNEREREKKRQNRFCSQNDILLSQGNWNEDDREQCDQKKLPYFYKSFLKMFSLEKW